MLEMNKLIPELVLRFDIRMADPGHDWTIFDDGFVKPHDFLVKVVERRENE